VRARLEFASGKADGFERDKVTQSAALTPEQREILEKRGVLSPDEIHRLASKTRKAVGAEGSKAECHSDYVEPQTAQQIQEQRLVQLRLKPEVSAAE